MWGSYLRDSATIPSIVSRRLTANPSAGTTFEVINFGESGWVFTQELLELELQLRAGNVPNIVVFFDGMNDVGSAAQSGQVGIPQNEVNRSREFEFGRAIFGTETGVGTDLRAGRAIGSAIVLRLQFLQRLVAALAKGAPQRSSSELSEAYVHMYAGNVDLVEALSHAYGFSVIYVWQPSLHATLKTPTPWESQLLASNGRDGFYQRLQAIHRALPPLLEAAVKPKVGIRFVNMAAAFRGDTSSVFTDALGHYTEKAIPTIVDGFWPQLSAMIDSMHARGGHTRTR